MNMEFVYKRAGLEDIELLVKTRIEVLCAANCLSDDTEMPLVKQQSREYYEECLQAETHIAYLFLMESGLSVQEESAFSG